MLRPTILTTSLLLTIPLVIAQPQPTFEGLGAIPGSGGAQSIASGVSNDGLVVVGTGNHNPGGEEAFRWEDGEMEGLGFLSSNDVSQAKNVSAGGSVVVGLAHLDNGLFEAFRWEDGEMEGLGFLHSGEAWSEAFDVSADGSVVVGGASSENGIIEAYRWTAAGEMEALGDLPGGGFSSRAFGVSDDGSVVVGRARSANGDEAFRWTEEEGMEPLLTGGGFDGSIAQAASDDGSVVVGHTVRTDPDIVQAFHFDVEGPSRTDLGDLEGGDFFSIPAAVSSDGAIVVGQSDSDLGLEAFIWSTGMSEMRNLKELLEEDYELDLTGWILRSAEDVSHSDAGVTIVGFGENPDGLTEAWRATLPRFPGVGGLNHVSAHFLSFPEAVSADGSVVVGWAVSDSGSEAFRWENGVITGLGDLAGGDLSSRAFGVSNDGSVVVGESSTATCCGTEAFRWTEEDGMIGLGDLPGGGLPFSRAHDVSSDGSVVVGRGNTDDGFEAFRWEDGEMVRLGDLPGGSFHSRANGVSDNGSVVIGAGLSEDGLEAFRWTENDGMVGLGDLPGGSFSSEAEAISADGSVVVGGSSSENGFEAFRWTEDGGMVGLGDLPGGGFSSRADAVSFDGSIVVGHGDSGGGAPFGREAFVWTEEEGILNVPELVEEEYEGYINNWVFGEATGVGVTSAGEVIVVGRGLNLLGLEEGYRIPLTGIDPVSNDTSPAEISESLSVPRPNPTSATTSLKLRVPTAQHVTVAVFDALGRRVQTLFDDALAAGTVETLTFDASAMPAGVYMIRASGVDVAHTQRVTIVK